MREVNPRSWVENLSATRSVRIQGGRDEDRDPGRDITAEVGQRITVRIGECQVLLGEVTSLAPVAGVTSETIFGIAGAAGFGYAAYEFFRKKPVSSN